MVYQEDFWKRSFLKLREKQAEAKSLSGWKEACVCQSLYTVSYASYCKSTQQPVQRIVSLGVKILLYWDALELGITTFISISDEEKKKLQVCYKYQREIILQWGYTMNIYLTNNIEMKWNILMKLKKKKRRKRRTEMKQQA